MVFDGANAGLDKVISGTRERLDNFRNTRGRDWQVLAGDDDFVRAMVKQFVDQAADAPHGAGAVTMALSAYRLALMQIENERLEEALDMRNAALELMWAIDDHAEGLCD